MNSAVALPKVPAKCGDFSLEELSIVDDERYSHQSQ